MCLLALLSGCSRMQASTNATLSRDITYGMGYKAESATETPTLEALHMDVLHPEEQGAAPRPAVIMIHGGGFERGSKEDKQLAALAEVLHEAGYVCFLINYRLIKDYPPAPESLADPMSRAAHAAAVDVKTAVRHVRVRAAHYGVDPERIALLGSSAGAIAALAAGLSTDERFLQDGPDYPPPSANHPGTPAQVAAIVNLWGSADFFPELFGPHAPPIMTVHGDKDFRVGISLMPAMNIDAYCKQYGIPHHYYPIPEAGHGVWDAVVDEKPLSTLAVEFLDQYVKR